jgi:hypothetical protein
LRCRSERTVARIRELPDVPLREAAGAGVAIVISVRREGVDLDWSS